VGLLVFALILGICYLIGQLGVQIKSGICIIRFVRNTEKEIKAEGLILNDKGLALKKKGQRKIALPLIGISVFYLCVWLFLPSLELKNVTLLLLIPVILGYFGIFLVPEQMAED